MVARIQFYIKSKDNINKGITGYSQTEPLIKKFDILKKDKNSVNIFFKAENIIKEIKNENKENIHLENDINKNNNLNNIIIEPKKNSVININITGNNNIINKSKNNNNILLRSSANNFNNNNNNQNKNIIKKEKIQIDANKKEEDEKEIKIQNNNKNTTGLRLHKSVDRYSHMNNTKLRKSTYKLKSKGKIFNKK